MSQPDKRLSELEEFLADTSGESTAETRRFLRSQGVDTTKFFRRVQQTVEEGYSEQLRALATLEQERKTAASYLGQLAGMPREAMLAFFDNLRKGELGGRNQEAALARCRNKDASELSDDELRSWLEDIGETLGDPQE
jgi:hypothetical protein